MLSFKMDKPGERKLKTLIYGLDGAGKSTAAELYCKKRDLHPVCVDMDDTNYTDVPRVDVDWKQDRDVVNGMKEIIRDIQRDEHFDTLIIDGCGTLSNLLIPPIKESQRAYLLRTQNFKKIWKCMLNSDINIIFIGQKDLIVTEENDSSKFAEMINNMVDWKFRCYRNGSAFKVECTKWRREKEELY
ncbi:hypothetical protein MBORA_15870 [Methanobrevibacter oralis]|uniref:Uncharacterized protein n=1 Tax=Methanobrevibacter oralis TaxID=66851 RepID=A0A165ZYR3_METOA|nr:AAA family ATPase [Methanobrevibacter oralis]KZX11342.1 hypothetical protein MBORA_15870 [Methanobrevibacter oralis]